MPDGTLWYWLTEHAPVGGPATKLGRFDPSRLRWEMRDESGNWRGQTGEIASETLGHHRLINGAITLEPRSAGALPDGIVCLSHRFAGVGLNIHGSLYHTRLSSNGAEFWIGPGQWSKWNAKSLVYSNAFNQAGAFAANRLRSGDIIAVGQTSNGPGTLSLSWYREAEDDWHTWFQNRWTSSTESVSSAMPYGIGTSPHLFEEQSSGRTLLLYNHRDGARCSLRAGRITLGTVPEFEFWSSQGWTTQSSLAVAISPLDCGGSGDLGPRFILHTASIAGSVIVASQLGQQIVSYRYDDRTGQLVPLPLLEGSQPRLTATSSGDIVLVFRRGEQLWESRLSGVHWSTPRSHGALPGTLMAVGSVQNRLVVFAEQSSFLNGTRRSSLLALAPQGDAGALQGELRGALGGPLPHPRPAAEYISHTGTWDSAPFVSVYSSLTSRTEVWRSDYGAGMCGHLSLVLTSQGLRMSCPKFANNTISFFPADYRPAPSWEEERARTWGAGWDYLWHPTSTAFDSVTGSVFVADSVVAGGAGDQMPWGRIQIWPAGRANEDVAWRRPPFPWPVIVPPQERFIPTLVTDFSPSPGEQRLNIPGAMVVDEARRILYVAEAGAGRILRFEISGSPARLTLLPPLVEGLEYPQGLAIDPQGRLYVAESGAHRIRVLSPEGTLLSEFGAYGVAPGQLMFPLSVAVSDRFIAVGEPVNQRIQIFSHAGTLRKTISGFRGAPCQWGGQLCPLIGVGGLSITPEGDLIAGVTVLRDQLSTVLLGMAVSPVSVGE